MKYKIGDKVRVKEDLKVGTVYGDYYFNKEMAKLKGKVVEINDLGCNSYSIKEGRYSWTEEMFSGLAEPKNLIPLIAKELGVEMGEEFKVSDRPYAFKFTDDRLVSIEDDGGTYNANYTFFELISGNEKIIKLPKKPKLTEAERVILENLPKEYKYIKRSKYDLYVYDDADTETEYLNMFSHLFQFIIREDKEPYNIEELLKGEQL